MNYPQSQIEELRAIRAAMDAAGAVLNDAQALAAVMLYRAWKPEEAVAVGDIRRVEQDLYKCVQAHTTQPDWMPAATPALWTRIAVEAWPAWVQPTGAQDAYAQGAKVSHANQHWISTVNANVWEPGVYGWMAG